jgi:hypothetical protein
VQGHIFQNEDETFSISCETTMSLIKIHTCADAAHRYPVFVQSFKHVIFLYFVDTWEFSFTTQVSHYFVPSDACGQCVESRLMIDVP